MLDEFLDREPELRGDALERGEFSRWKIAHDHERGAGLRSGPTAIDHDLQVVDHDPCVSRPDPGGFRRISAVRSKLCGVRVIARHFLGTSRTAE